jgi:hypothetical protein
MRLQLVAAARLLRSNYFTTKKRTNPSRWIGTNLQNYYLFLPFIICKAVNLIKPLGDNCKLVILVIAVSTFKNLVG